MKRLASFALTLFTLLPFGLNAQDPVTYDRLTNAAKEPRNWLMYGGDYFSDRFSPLTQITAREREKSQSVVGLSVGGLRQLGIHSTGGRRNYVRDPAA